MFETFVVQPIFNLLALIYALIPGHNFGVAIIIFTIIVRLLMWPLVKRQLHQTRATRAMQPDIKRINKAAKGDRQKRDMMVMELYKEKGINPFAALLPMLVQLPIFIGLYMGLRKVVEDPQQIVAFSYSFVKNLPFMQDLAQDIGQFDETLFGFIDLAQPALGPDGVYLFALLIVLGSVVVQYYQAKQLMPNDKDARSLRQILKDASNGQEADQLEINAAIGRSTRFLLPGMVFVFTVSIPSALSLYWLTSGLVAFAQQRHVLNKDESEMEALAGGNKRGGARVVNITHIPEAEIVDTVPTPSKNQKSNQSPKKKSPKKRKKRKK